MHRTLVLALVLAGACKPTPPVETDTDADTDTDTDTDTDADTDTDTDTDSDTDTDTDVDVQCPNDDPDEPNDTVATAIARTAGTGLVVCDESHDHWRIEVPPTQAVEVSIAFTHADGDLDLLLVDPLFGGDLAISQSETDDEALLWVNEAAIVAPVVVHVYGYSGAGNTYDLASTFHECTVDPNEPDDTPTEATIGLSVTDRTVDAASPDVFDLGTIAADEALAVTFDFDALLGDVALDLLDLDGIPLASTGATNGEGLLQWNNPSDDPLQVFARFRLEDGFCGRYAFDAEVLSPVPEICDDGIDNDLDGWFDCDDYSCAAAPACPLGCSSDDAGEDNDSPAAATNLPSAISNLTHVEDADWFVVVLGPLEYAAVEATHAPSEDPLYLVALDDAGALVLDTTSSNGSALLEWFNPTDGPVTYMVGVEVATGGICAIYDLDYATGPLPPEICDDLDDNDLDGQADCADYDCLEHPACEGVCPPEDLLENNDTALEATSEPDGTGLMTHVQDEDYYVLTLPDQALASVDATIQTPGADVDLQVFAPDGTLVVSGNTVNPVESVFWVNRTGGPVDYFVRVYPAVGAAPCSAYDLTTTVIPIPAEACQDTVDNDLDGFTDCDDYDCLTELQCVSTCPLEDALEDNDRIEDAVDEPMGTNLMVHPQDPDWYRLTLQPDESVTLALSYFASGGNIAMHIEDDLGFSLLDSDEAADLVFAQWNNQTAAARDYFVQISSSPLGDQCNRYDLTPQVVLGTTEACDDFFDNDGDGAVDCQDADCIGEATACGCDTDLFEGNHEPATATALPPGTTSDLVAPIQGGDWFSTSVPAGDTFEILLAHDALQAELDVVAFRAGGVQVASGVPEVGGERLTWTNSGATAAQLYLNVSLEQGITNPVCGTYSLQVVAP